jgi:hypothetical protein
LLDFIEVPGCGILEQAETERLGDRRVGSIEDHVGASDANGLGAALRKKPTPGHRKLSACVALGGFETTAQGF